MCELCRTNNEENVRLRNEFLTKSIAPIEYLEFPPPSPSPPEKGLFASSWGLGIEQQIERYVDEIARSFGQTKSNYPEKKMPTNNEAKAEELLQNISSDVLEILFQRMLTLRMYVNKTKYSIQFDQESPSMMRIIAVPHPPSKGNDGYAGYEVIDTRPVEEKKPLGIVPPKNAVKWG